MLVLNALIIWRNPPCQIARPFFLDGCGLRIAIALIQSAARCPTGFLRKTGVVAMLQGGHDFGFPFLDSGKFFRGINVDHPLIRKRSYDGSGNRMCSQRIRRRWRIRWWAWRCGFGEMRQYRLELFGQPGFPGRDHIGRRWGGGLSDFFHIVVRVENVELIGRNEECGGKIQAL